MHEDYFLRKRAQLGMDRADVLEQIQAVLEEWYPGLVRAKQLHQGVLRLITPSASVAGELRMRQVELLASLPVEFDTKVRLAISISTLS
jgi:hypothetical protein